MKNPRVSGSRRMGIVALTAVAALLAACGGGASTSGSDGPVQLGFAAYGLDTAFLSTLSTKVQDAGRAAGATVNVSTADGDASKQANDVNTLVSAGARGVLIDPVDADAIVPAITRADAQGAKVVAIDGSAAGGPLAIQVATDNYGAGQAACQVIGDQLGGTGTVLNLQGTLTNQAGRNRSDGFTECMAANYPQITVVSNAFNFDAALCSQLAQTQLSTAQIDGVFAAAAQCLGPVTSVLQSTGRLVLAGQPGHVPFVTIDGTPEELQAVREGTLTASIAQPLQEMSEIGVYWLLRAINDQPIAAGPTEHGTTVVEVDGTLRDLLAPVVVTRDNVDDPALWANAPQ